MKLYDFPFSPNCRKVRAVAYELGIALDHVHVNLLRDEQRTPAFLARNPNGRVPVLEDGDFVLWELTAIQRYLAAGTSLMPTDRRAAAEVDCWLAWQVAHMAPALRKVAFERIVKPASRRGVPDQAQIDAGTAEVAEVSAVLDRELGTREYVAGRLSIADFALAAHYSLAPACGIELAGFERLGPWLARMLARDSMKRALADGQAAP